MPAISSPAGSSTVAQETGATAVVATPAPGRNEERSYHLPVGAGLQPFAINLKSNARWMKRFLHGGK
jgi:hypothetical protein